VKDEAAVTAAVSDLVASVRALRASFAGTIIVALPPYPSTPVFDLLDLQQSSTGGALHRRVLDSFSAEMDKIGRVRLLDLHSLMLRTGVENAFDPRTCALYRQPWTTAFWARIGEHLGRIISAETRPAKKCIVLDCDNTLWGGIVGEDGIGGIALGSEFPGSAFCAFQEHLLHLRARGVLLAVASKNNKEDVAEVFDRHDAMVLKKSHISVFEVHWESKVDSIRRIAKTLNIGTDAIVFVDDSAKEIAEVQERLPEVACVQAPEEVADHPFILCGRDFFDLPEITGEDRARADMMTAEAERRALKETMSEAEFKAALGVEMTVFRADRQHIARITQLINKTNQFNLTTRRRTQDEVEALAGAKTHAVLGMTLKDRYGDYGLVGVAILEKRGDVCLIDTLLMSCRVLGRGAEEAFLAALALAAAGMGCTHIEGRYIPTQKNAMVKDFYAARGFAAQGDVFISEVSAIPPCPMHIRTACEF
jgi:FkbH-like protein